MGYDTKLVFVSNSGHRSKGRMVGYCSVIATLEMGCCSYHDMGDLINKCRENNKEHEADLLVNVERARELYKNLFTSDGEYTEEVAGLTKEARQERIDAYYKLKKAIEKRLPFFFADNGNDELYTDSYGDLLLVASLADVKRAIVKSNAKSIANGEHDMGYRRFNTAVKLIEGLEDFGEDVEVIMFGH